MSRQRIETLTLRELQELFRDYGIPCSDVSVRAHILAGNFPFACGSKEGKPGELGKYHFLIFKREAIEWLEARCGA